MSQKPKFSISGLRGVWGETLTEEIARSYIEAYAVFLQKRNAKKVVLGRDSRISGPIIKAIAINIFTKAGLEVVDAGIVPTPTIIFLFVIPHSMELSCLQLRTTLPSTTALNFSMEMHSSLIRRNWMK